MQTRYAPGARVVIRDCEWIVRRADASDDGGYVLTVDGLSELVSGKSARFLTRLEEAEDAIQLLDPAHTRFEQDLTPALKKPPVHRDPAAPDHLGGSAHPSRPQGRHGPGAVSA
ncbi:hypothetical protein [Vreelandella azerica]|uniref:hypothetical protein n=1 Tax=Vreelandella azerica TaxID=2732867 RepID=UPI001C10699E|nr:hypothetical protein [Halomonas azerica]